MILMSDQTLVQMGADCLQPGLYMAENFKPQLGYLILRWPLLLLWNLCYLFPFLPVTHVLNNCTQYHNSVVSIGIYYVIALK